MTTTAESVAIKRERTAIHRPHLSRPLQLAIDDGLLSSATTVFDYGCGFGDDVRFLTQMSIVAGGWDPASFPENPKRAADIVNIGYVVNVIEDPVERSSVVVDAWRHTKRLLIVSARLSHEANSTLWQPFVDGVITGRGLGGHPKPANGGHLKTGQ